MTRRTTNDQNEKMGRFLGMPYDWHKPTWPRLKSSVWNPGQRRLFIPKVFGWGYSINFHELLRRMHLLR